MKIGYIMGLLFILLFLTAQGCQKAEAPAAQTTGPEQTAEEPELITIVDTTPPEEETEPAVTQPTVREFTMTAKRFSFEPDTITVNKGDTVRLTITSTDVTHGFAINEYGINIQLAPGKTETVEFVADKTGTFTFYCSIVCGSGHSGMRGRLVVR